MIVWFGNFVYFSFFSQVLTAILSRKNCVLVVYFRHSLQGFDLCSRYDGRPCGHSRMNIVILVHVWWLLKCILVVELGQQYTGSTVCCTTHSVQMCYKQCDLVDHSMVENVNINQILSFSLPS